LLYRRFVLPQKINAIAHTNHCDHGCGYKLICQRFFYSKNARTVDNGMYNYTWQNTFANIEQHRKPDFTFLKQFFIPRHLSYSRFVMRIDIHAPLLSIKLASGTMEISTASLLVA